MGQHQNPLLKMENKEKNPGGRPREHNREQIALDLVDWAKNSDSINLCKFCATRDPPLWPEKLSRWAKECEVFRQAYETAKAFLGFRREEMLSEQTLHVKAYDLNATTYDYFLAEEKRRQAEFEAKLAAQESNTLTENDIKRFDATMGMLSQLQSSQRSVAESNKSKE